MTGSRQCHRSKAVIRKNLLTRRRQHEQRKIGCARIRPLQHGQTVFGTGRKLARDFGHLQLRQLCQKPFGAAAIADEEIDAAVCERCDSRVRIGIDVSP